MSSLLRPGVSCVSRAGSGYTRGRGSLILHRPSTGLYTSLLQWSSGRPSLPVLRERFTRRVSPCLKSYCQVSTGKMTGFEHALSFSQARFTLTHDYKDGPRKAFTWIDFIFVMLFYGVFWSTHKNC